MSTLSQRAEDARASVSRTLRGARPSGRRLAKRFQHILRPAREQLVLLVWSKDGESSQRVLTRLSRAGVVGQLTELAREEEGRHQAEALARRAS